MFKSSMFVLFGLIMFTNALEGQQHQVTVNFNDPKYVHSTIAQNPCPRPCIDPQPIPAVKIDPKPCPVVQIVPQPSSQPVPAVKIDPRPFPVVQIVPQPVVTKFIDPRPLPLATKCTLDDMTLIASLINAMYQRIFDKCALDVGVDFNNNLLGFLHTVAQDCSSLYCKKAMVVMMPSRNLLPKCCIDNHLVIPISNFFGFVNKKCKLGGQDDPMFEWKLVCLYYRSLWNVFNFFNNVFNFFTCIILVMKTCQIVHDDKFPEEEWIPLEYSTYICPWPAAVKRNKRKRCSSHGSIIKKLKIFHATQPVPVVKIDPQPVIKLRAPRLYVKDVIYKQDRFAEYFSSGMESRRLRVEANRLSGLIKKFKKLVIN